MMRFTGNVRRLLPFGLLLIAVSLSVGAGKPVAVTVKEPAAPTVNAALLALVMAGAWFTVSVKLCVALLPTPLLAVKVSA